MLGRYQVSRDAFVLRRPPSAFGPLAYYPPNAIKRAEWLTAGAADAARVNLIDAAAWTSGCAARAACSSF